MSRRGPQSNTYKRNINPRRESHHTPLFNKQIYTMPHRSPDTLLGQTSVPAMALRANGEGYQTPADFAIRNVGNVKVGR